MTGNYNSQPKRHTGNWSTFEKRGAGSAKFAKYDNVLRVIVSGKYEPKTKDTIDTRQNIYLSKMAQTALGDPDYIRVYEDGDIIGFAATDKDDPNGYSYHSPHKTKEDGDPDEAGRKFISARALITRFNLKPGVYEAGKEINGPSIIIFFSAQDEPSQI